MDIIKINKDREKYIDLLLEADPDRDVVNKYINEGELFVGFVDDVPVCEVLIVKVDNDECELKNIATLRNCRGKGYANEIIKYVFNEYKGKYKKIIVGTTENMIPFYVLNGFTKYHHTVKNFFVDNYEEEIWDGDLHCIDMYYYYRNLEEL